MDLDQLDAERLGPFSVRLRGERIVLPAPSTLSWRNTATAATSGHHFMQLVWPKEIGLPAWMVEPVQKAWRIHHGIPEVDDIQRLIYTMNRYVEAVEYDLRDKLDLSAGQLWRERRWRELLNYIDSLPSNTMTSQALANDKEHLRMVLKQGARQKGAGGPRLADWSLTNAQLAGLIDAVNALRITTIGLSGAKGAKPSFEPQPRPRTAVDEIEYEMRKAQHEEMVGMLVRKAE